MAEEANVKNSILKSIKKMLGILPEITDFDDELIMHINSAISNVSQLGIGKTPNEGYVIQDANNTWSDFLGDDNRFESIKTYIYMKVKLIFDTPSQTAVIEAYKALIAEFEWRNYTTKKNETNT